MAVEWKANETMRRAVRHLGQARKLLTDERLSVSRFDSTIFLNMQDELYMIEDAVELLRDRTQGFDLKDLEEISDGR